MEKIKNDIIEDEDESFYDLTSNGEVGEFGTHDICYTEDEFLGYTIDNVDHEDHCELIKGWKNVFTELGFVVSKEIEFETYSEE